MKIHKHLFHNSLILISKNNTIRGIKFYLNEKHSNRVSGNKVKDASSVVVFVLHVYDGMAK